jgi:hypothetical protein
MSKPPIGIIPKHLDNSDPEERFEELKRAITVHVKEDLPIDVGWIYEYNDYLE